LIKLEKICGGYGKKQIISDITLTFEQGKITTLVGANGSGKSTLLQLSAGLIIPFGGKVLLKGKDLSCIRGSDIAKQVSYLPQIRTAGNITVHSLVSHGRFPYLGYPRRYTSDDNEKIKQAMDIAGVSELADSAVSKLSGGQQQKVYIAMLLAQDTEIVFLDEPITYLDINHQLDLMELVQKLKYMGKTIIMVLHDLNFALAYSDTIFVVDNGRIAEAGTPCEIVNSGIFEKIFGIEAMQDESSKQYFFKRRQMESNEELYCLTN